MDLEHSQLDPFEPALSRLMGIAHTSGIWELEKKGFKLPDIRDSRPALRAFLRGCHDGYDLAQRQIASLVIEIEHKTPRKMSHNIAAERHRYLEG